MMDKFVEGEPVLVAGAPDHKPELATVDHDTGVITRMATTRIKAMKQAARAQAAARNLVPPAKHADETKMAKILAKVSAAPGADVLNEKDFLKMGTMSRKERRGALAALKRARRKGNPELKRDAKNEPPKASATNPLIMSPTAYAAMKASMR